MFNFPNVERRIQNCAEVQCEDEISSVTGRVFVPKTPEIFTYDADGNMTGGGRFRYFWNEENRMVCASNAEVVVTYAYDHRGRMIRKNISRGAAEMQSISYTWDNWNIISETQATGRSLQATYNVWGLDLDGTMQGAGGVGGLLAVVRDGETYIPAYDANGNISEYISAADGSIAAHRDYSPFGEPVISVGDCSAFSHWFSTKPWCGDTKLLEYQFRKYSPEIGRWMSRDPMGERNSINLSEFTLNTPNRYVDVLGLDNWGHSPPWGGGNQNAPAIPPGMGIPDNWFTNISSPGILDQINPYGIFGRKGEADYTRWFETRFPRTISGAKALLRKRIVNNACLKSSLRPKSLPDMVGKDDVDISPDMRRFGDKPEGLWERYVQIGSFEIKADNIKLEWVSPCCFMYSATVFVLEHTGADSPSEPGGECFGVDPLWFTGLFVARDVRMANWRISGTWCCGDYHEIEE